MCMQMGQRARERATSVYDPEHLIRAQIKCYADGAVKGCPERFCL
jgi:hypothetical protein